MPIWAPGKFESRGDSLCILKMSSLDGIGGRKHFNRAEISGAGKIVVKAENFVEVFPVNMMKKLWRYENSVAE